jgi:SAM-dependent methyltransferase
MAMFASRIEKERLIIDANGDEFADLEGLMAVLDSEDVEGFKNRLIDRIQWIAFASTLKGSKHLLDFGCGIGRFADRIRHLGTEYAGIDISRKMIEKANRLHSVQGQKFVHYDEGKIPFPDASFDVCLTSYVYQYVIHTDRNSNVLSEIYRCLSPGGRFVLIEQGSLSNQGSRLGPSRPLTEADYVTELSSLFRVKSIGRIRLGNLSTLSLQSFKLFEHIPNLADYLLGYLAAWEIHRARIIKLDALSRIQYYDILINAEKEQGGLYETEGERMVAREK